MNVQVACASAYIKIFWSPQDCLWGLPFPGRAMKPESILENSALDKWTQSCRHGTASEKISPTLQEKTSLNSPTIQWSISQKERVVFIHNTPSSTSTYALIAHLYSAWICWVQEKSVQPLKTDSLRRTSSLWWSVRKQICIILGTWYCQFQEVAQTF